MGPWAAKCYLGDSLRSRGPPEDHLGAHGCAGFVMQFNIYNIYVDDLMSLISLLYGMPPSNCSSRVCVCVCVCRRCIARTSIRHVTGFREQIVSENSLPRTLPISTLHVRIGP